MVEKLIKTQISLAETTKDIYSVTPEKCPLCKKSVWLQIACCVFSPREYLHICPYSGEKGLSSSMDPNAETSYCTHPKEY